VRQRLGIALGLSAALAGVDLVVQASVAADPGLAHHRTVTWLVLSFGILAVVLGSAVLPSRLLAVAAGVLGGGLAGNVGSAVLHARTIPNPFVAGNVAFNLADAFVVAGLILGGIAVMRLAERYRHLLPRHTIPVRLARYVAARCAAARNG
jgi:lipoprotein signal peptidase